MPIISLKDISKIYGFGDATTVALEDVDLEINKGEFVAIMGPSGSGKSTLLNIIGLLDRASYGIYRLDGRPVERLSSNARAKARRDKIGFVFQSANLLPKMTVLENVALPLAYKGRLLTRRTKAAHKILERVGMTDREYFTPHQLSGGQIQRAAIARALINDPALIIADEPTGNLDSIASRIVMELLSEIHELGNTVLMVTHNPELTRYANRVLYMYDGNIEYDFQKKIGSLARSPRKTTLFAPEGSIEDDLERVGAKMKLSDEKEAAKPKVKAKAKKRTSAKRRSKARRKPNV